MLEANFSESQLQQAANTAYVRAAFERTSEWHFALVPSLHREFDLGWDSAFFFDWLLYPASPSDEGCNFFLQYKLSGELTSPGAGEWSQWRQRYFRFKIPHSASDPTTKLTSDDYHQWDCLKSLADRGYPTFYATNWTLHLADLKAALKAGTFLEQLALLDVRTVRTRHRHATFTSASTVFALHSEKEESAKLNLAEVIAKLSEQRQLTIANAVAALGEALTSLNDEIAESVRAIQASSLQNIPDRLRPWAKWYRFASLVHRELGSELLWLSRKAG